MSTQTPPLQISAATNPALQRVAKMFAALDATNKAILRTTSQADLFAQVCVAALQSGEFAATAILMPEPGTDMLKAVAGAGRDARARAACYSISEVFAGNGPAGLAFRDRKSGVSNVPTDERTRLVAEGSPMSEVRAVAALPMIRAGASAGVLVVMAYEAGSLDQEAVSLLARMAENLSFGLDNLDRETERKRSERASRRLAKMYAALSKPTNLSCTLGRRMNSTSWYA